MLKMQARIDVVHVPYKGTPQAVTDLLAGQVSFMFANALSVLPQVNAGRLRAIGVTSSKRSAASPQLPTVAESGLPGFESGTWFAVLAPAGAPREAVTRLGTEIAKLTQHPDIREKLSAQGAEAVTLTPEQTAAYIRGEVAKWGKVVKASGARVD
jgi:tripartite-type tricarboxylate transporter receptor subunit TctC